MQVSGTKPFPTSPSQTYTLLTDPEVLVKAMPGLKSLRALSTTAYEADLEVGVAGIKGRYQGHIEMKDVVQDTSYTLLVNGEGLMGFMEAEVAITLAASDANGCILTYDGDAKVGGTVAGVGQRVLGGVAKLLINQFFSGIGKEAAALAGR